MAHERTDEGQPVDPQAAAQVAEARSVLVERRKLRKRNREPARPDEADMKGKDASVKRNTALLKKLRSLSEEARVTTCDDICRTNQGKYVSEVVTALLDANLKTKDITAAVEACSLLHQRYADFSALLVAELTQVLSSPFKTGTEDDRGGATRRRALLRLLGELLLAGVHDDVNALLRAVRALAVPDTPGGTPSAAALSVLASFFKFGREEFLGLPPAFPLSATLQSQAETGANEPMAAELEAYKIELAERYMVPAELQAQIYTVATATYDAACSALTNEHAALAASEVEAGRLLNSRGEVPEEVADAYERQRRAWDALQRTVGTLAEVLGRQMPALPASAPIRLAASATGITILSGREDEELASSPFEDDGARNFYETLPDLHALVPGTLLPASQGPTDPEADTGPKSLEQAAETGTTPSTAKDGPEQTGHKPEGAGEQEITAGEARAEVEALLTRLPGLGDAGDCDAWVIAFCSVSSRQARKRLARTLADVASSAAQVPLCARVAASLAPVFPDVSAQLVHILEDEFAALQAQKDPTQRTMDARMRNAQYIAELVKFRVLPPGTFFAMLRALTDDFAGHNVDASAALVEGAGFFLARLPATRARMFKALEVMGRLKAGRNLDARQSAAIASALISADPPQRPLLRRKRRPPLHEYMRYLLRAVLAPAHLKHVMRKLRRVPWPENETYMVRCLLSAAKARWGHTSLVASLVAGLSRYHPSLGIALADELLEQIRADLELPDGGGAYQKRVAYMRLLGEQYNYRLIDSKTIFDTLYMLLAFGHETEEMGQRLDPPASYFRVRLVCVLLEACGGYFRSGSAARRLDRFLTVFQRYVLSKPPPPTDVEFDLQDLWEHLRPGHARYASYEEAAAAVDEIEASETAAAAAGQPVDGDSDSDPDDGRHSAASDIEGDAPVNLTADEGESGAEGSIGPASATEGEEEAVRVQRPHRTVELDPGFEAEMAALEAQYQNRPSHSSHDAHSAASEQGTVARQANSVPTRAFRVMMRRSGRPDKSRALQIPADSALARGLRAGEAAEETARAEMKALVLASADADGGHSGVRLHRPGGRR